MNQTETVLASQPIYDGKIVHLRVDTVRLPDGREAKREIVGHNGAVCIVPQMPDGSIAFVRQFRLPAGKSLLEIPAGKLEEGEDPAACAGRELEEEIGYTAGQLSPLGTFYLAPGYSTELMHAYMATDLRQTATNPDEDENLEIETVALADVARMAAEGAFQDAKTLAALWLALRRLGDGLGLS